ncbi:MAG TPA: phosphoenolpyruvate--protein phosphotransferase, partial [bacterium (Candidatus Stahlbacteria)]|nr:phosphoenolpyruvate--protein phosphotransferase [Candidatus Stahlbacteria bacterium]
MKNKLLRGIPASPGVVIEKAYIHGGKEFIIPERTIAPNEVRSEIEKFKKALRAAKGEIKAIQQQFLKKTDKYHARIFDMQMLILEDKKLINEAIQIIRKERKNAEYVFQNLIKKIISNFDSSKEYFRERTSDIKDVLNRVLYHLTSKTFQELSSLSGECVAIAHHLTPSDTVKFSKDKIVGFATDLGGKTAHVAIMARALGIPAVVGLKEVTKFVETGERVIIDGTRGIVIIDPDEATQRSYEERRKKFQDYTKELETLDELPPTTIDGHTIDLSANIELPIEINAALSHGAKGIGLFRTEFLYFNGPPSEEDQYKIYSYVAEKVYPDSVIIRTLDLGGDKISPSYGIEDPNPYLGWRAIRFSLT